MIATKKRPPQRTAKRAVPKPPMSVARESRIGNLLSEGFSPSLPTEQETELATESSRQLIKLLSKKPKSVLPIQILPDDGNGKTVEIPLSAFRFTIPQAGTRTARGARSLRETGYPQTAFRRRRPTC